MTKTVLFIGGGIETYPGIKICKDRGYKIILADANRNCYCKKSADFFINESTYEPKKIVKKIKKKFDIDAVLSVGVDVPYSVSYLAKKTGCRSIPIKTAIICSDKFKFKKVIQGKIKTSRFVTLKKKDDLKKIKFKKIIIKPVDNRGARGVIICNKKSIKDHINNSFQYTKKKYLLAEEYIDGPQLSTESIIINFKATTFSISDRNYKDTKKLRPFVIENGSDMPSIYEKRFYKKINYTISKLAKILNVKNGVLKGDLVIKNKEIFVIEAAPRLSGGFFCSHMLPLSNGINLIDIYLDLLLFGKVDEKKLKKKYTRYVSQRFVFAKEGKIESVKISKEVKKLCDLHIVYKKKGAYQPKIQSHPDRSAMIICSGEKKNDVKKDTQRLINQIIYK